ncbi:MAG: hypothetical protein E7378_03325 [Clostridiales bacterium]|nr:hypothetical protein [Clostridiales bacterium]
MTTKQKTWSKTLLSSYYYLERLCDSIDKLVNQTAVNSYFSSSSQLYNNSVMDISNRIIDLSNRKIEYINLKVLIEKTLETMPKKLAKLLILKYMQKISIEKCCMLLNMSMRSCYRLLDKSLACFSEQIARFGYNTQKLEIVYWDDKFIKSIYTLIEQDKCVMDEKADVISNDSVFNTFIKELIAQTAVC